jgi:hypothetical protein
MWQKQRGFTIVEGVMFLSISAIMFSVAYVSSRNQQEGVAFRQSMNGIETKIRETLNSIDNGYYGNEGNYSCTYTALGGFVFTPGGGAGNNASCVFRAKTIAVSADNKKMLIKTIVSNTALTKQAELPSVQNYSFEYGVEYFGYKVGPSVLMNTSPLIVSALCPNTVAEPAVCIGNDQRASRFIETLAWEQGPNKYNYYNQNNVVSNDRQALLCFKSSDKKGSITITSRDISVDYTGKDCV